jgi:CCR4-NOT transcription complex subunit 6
MSSGKKNTLSAPPTPSGAIPIVAPPATRTAASSSTMGTPDRPSRIAMSQSAHNLSLDAADYSPVNRHPHSTNASSASGPNSSNTHGPELSSGSGRRQQTTTQVHIDPSFEASELLGLDMSGIRLRSLPLGLFHSSLEGLYELHLNGNFLTKLPPQIGLLRQLIFLDLSENALQTVPKELGRLVNLQELLLHNNQLASLPAELGYLYQLESFSLDNNPLQEPLLSLVHSQGALSVITYLREHVLSTHSLTPLSHQQS